MPQIRNTKIQDIYHIIKSSKKFSMDDFKIEFPEKGNILAKIILRGSSKYSFFIEENFILKSKPTMLGISKNYNEEKTFQTVQKPAKNKNVEIDEHNDIDGCIYQISAWLYNLNEDLQNEFNFEDIGNLSNINEFEKRLDKKFPNENEKFTNEEKESLIQKINELQERIEKLENNENTKQSIQFLEESKIEIKTYPKKTWWLKFYNRIHNANKGLILLNDLKDNFIKLLENFGS